MREPPEERDAEPDVAPIYEQMTLFFPTEAEQIRAIDQEAESEKPSAFSVPQSDIDNVLRLGGSSDQSRMVVAAEYMKGKSVTELAGFLRMEYRGGMGIFTDSGRLSVWFGEEGIRLAAGDRAREKKAGMLLSWEDAAERIGELLDDGLFATNVEIEETPGYARTQIAEKLWYLRRDFSEITEGAGLLTSLQPYHGGGFPDETERLAKALADPEILAAVTRDMMIFSRVYEQRSDVLRFHYHRVSELHRSLRELGMTWKEYSSEMAEVPQPGCFITEDEIDETFAKGSYVSEGKGRIYSYFTDTHSTKELVGFLRSEYGQGGHSDALANKSYSFEDHDSKGITFKKMDCIPVTLSWSNVAKRISALIKDDRYLTEKEKQEFAAARSEEAKNSKKEQKAAAQETEIQRATPPLPLSVIPLSISCPLCWIRLPRTFHTRMPAKTLMRRKQEPKRMRLLKGRLPLLIILI
ncbi:MAG: hypothetical protein LIO67_07040 [Lachnospiraceae bacterium]|nr:hypothetical protein [Lachnospiraceae bacterium]